MRPASPSSPRAGDALEPDQPAGGVGQRDPPVGVLVQRARLVHGAPVADEVRERRRRAAGSASAPATRAAPRGSPPRTPPARGARAAPAPPARARSPPSSASRSSSTLRVSRPSRSRIATCSQREVPGRRRQVVRRHRGQAEAPVLLRRPRRPSRPARTRGSTSRARRARAGTPGPTARPTPRSSPITTAPARWASSARIADERLVVVPHVRALVGGHPARDPPQPEQPDDVVDPHTAGVAQRGRAPCRGTARTPAPPGDPVATAAGPTRWPELVELVRRRPDRHPAGQDVGQRPRVRPRRVCTPTARSSTRPTPHTGTAQRALDLGELLGEQPLQPAVEVDLVGVLLAPPGDRRAVRVAQLGRPAVDRQPVRLGQRAPGGVGRRGPRPPRPGSAGTRRPAARRARPRGAGPGRPASAPRTRRGRSPSSALSARPCAASAAEPGGVVRVQPGTSGTSSTRR